MLTRLIKIERVERNLLLYCLVLGILLISAWARAADVTLAWDANIEANLSGYKLHYGASSRSYTSSVSVGNVTSYKLTGLNPGQTYFFAATALDTSGAESGYSNEVSYAVPALPPETDSDGDGVPDSRDAFPHDPAEWADADGNGIGDNAAAAANQPPAAPVPLAPLGRAVVSLLPVLSTGAFSDPDAGDSHRETRWQIVQASNSLVVLDITTSEGLTSLAVPSLALEENTEYYWRALFYDQHGGASEWSEPAWFATDFSTADADGNGIPDDQEVDAATDLDGNGVNDAAESDVKAVQIRTGGPKIAIGTKVGSGNVAVAAIESTDPEVQTIDVDTDGLTDELPFGLINFKLVLDTAGAEAVVTVYFSEPAPKKGRWYKYDSARKVWADFSAFVQFSADRRSLTLTLADGGAGDADGTVNGIILDPAGVLVPSSSSGDSMVENAVEGFGGALESTGPGCFIQTMVDGPTGGCALGLLGLLSLMSLLCLLSFLRMLSELGLWKWSRFRVHGARRTAKADTSKARCAWLGEWNPAG
jgi:hypothetical protein